MKKGSLEILMSEKYGIDPSKIVATLKATAFKQAEGKSVSDEQLYMLMANAQKYNLNPFMREIYAYPDKKGGVVPLVGIDGWSKIIHSHKSFRGMKFEYSDKFITDPTNKHKPCYEWCKCIMYVNGFDHPVEITEWFDENYEAPKKSIQGGYDIIGSWQTKPKRRLRHKALIQCARVALGLSDIKPEDDFDAEVIEKETAVTPTIITVDTKLAHKKSKKEAAEVKAEVVEETTPVDTIPNVETQIPKLDIPFDFDGELEL